MKKILVLLTTAIFLLFGGCAPKYVLDRDTTTIGGKEVVQFKISGVKKGNTTPERGMEVLELQAKSQTQILLQDKLRAAIEAEDVEKIQKIIKIKAEVAESLANADRTAGTNNENDYNTNSRFLGAHNSTSEYVIEFLSEPLSGITLTPGEKTKIKKEFPVGLYKLVYNERRVSTSGCVKKEVNISIDRYRTMPITIINN